MVFRKKKNYIGVLLCVAVAAAPLLAGLSLLAVSGKNPLLMDAWKTAWNDEVVYYRAVRLMRLHGHPLGVTGYNEVAAQQLTYGPYNIFTYIPYFLLSFLTGVESHNYFYICNLIFAVLANLIFVALVRPSRRGAAFMAVFFLTYLIWGRYTWSGMIETSYNFYMIVFTGLVLWYVHHSPAAGAGKKAAVIMLMGAMTFFWSVMRPFYLPLLLLPLYYVWKKSPAFKAGGRLLLTLFLFAAGAGALFLFWYLGNHSVARYFSDAASPTKELIRLLSSRSPKYIARTVFDANIEGLREVRDYLYAANWIGAVSVLFYWEWLLLFVLWVASLIGRRGDGRAFALFTMLLSGALLYEATVVLYSPIQLHRMLLAMTVSYALFLADLGRTVLPTAHELGLLALMSFLVFNRPTSYIVPQMDISSITDQQEALQKKDLERLIPLKEDPWDNTIAKEAEGENLEYEFLLPSYAALNICQYQVLQEKITEGTLLSRYVLLSDDSDLVSLCEDQHSRYVKVWERYGHVLYKVNR